ncbi:MAG: putative molybdenum carrier protein [Elusimicrobiota bacterium]
MRVISGGQTGVDRAALDAAQELGLACGGTVPKGRLAEDGRIPDRYPMSESGSEEYPVRTERNVLDSDATLILTLGEPAGGTRLTLELAKRHKKPVCVVDLGWKKPAAQARDFVSRVKPETLNVAGPRESSFPGIGEKAKRLILEVLRDAQP